MLLQFFHTSDFIKNFCKRFGIDIDEVSHAEYLHNEFWLNQQDLVRTMDSLVEDYKDEDEELEGSYDSDDIELTS